MSLWSCVPTTCATFTRSLNNGKPDHSAKRGAPTSKTSVLLDVLRVHDLLASYLHLTIDKETSDTQRPKRSTQAWKNGLGRARVRRIPD